MTNPAEDYEGEMIEAQLMAAYERLVEDGTIRPPKAGQVCHFCAVTLNMPADFVADFCAAPQCPVKLLARIAELEKERS